MAKVASGYAWLAGLGALIVWGVLAGSLGEGFAIPTALAGIAGGAIVLRGPVGRALARRLEGETGGGAPPPDDLLVEMDELRGRLLELEERVDFSERLLASHRVPVAGSEEARP